MITGQFPEIRTKRLYLRRILPTDKKLVFAGLSHPEVFRYYGVNFNSLKATEKQMKWFKELEEKGAGVWWAICSHDNTQFYGACGFNNYDPQERSAEIGFWLLPEYWRKGITAEASCQILNYAFEELRMQRIEAFVETANTNSKKLLEKLGFILEKTMTNCEEKNGQLISLDVYVMLAKHPIARLH